MRFGQATLLKMFQSGADEISCYAFTPPPWADEDIFRESNLISGPLIFGFIPEHRDISGKFILIRGGKSRANGPLRRLHKILPFSQPDRRLRETLIPCLDVVLLFCLALHAPGSDRYLFQRGKKWNFLREIVPHCEN